ncbi:MAG TPA: serine hydrolase [Saprospiraceae bacterium]|nr:serine hydrolase [Saprospiraceae bacterium]
MKTQTLFLAFGLLFNLTVAQQQDVIQLATEFDKMLSEQFKTGEPGATVLVSRNGQTVYKKAFGMANLELDIPMRVEHVFRIGSITKQFTAIAILQLMEQGKLNLHDDITRFIPEYPTQGNPITIEHLLTHTSGIQSYTAMKEFMARMTLDFTPIEMIDYFKNEPMKFAPGTQFSYCNSGYFLLGYLIEVISGKSYPEYLDENIFKPLGMTNSLYGSNTRLIKNRASAYSQGDHGFENAHPLSMTQPYAAGSIQSTVEDLFKWHQAVHAYKLVKKESLEKAFTRYILTDGTETDYGYGWSFSYVQGSPTIEHGGGINGFSTMAIYLPKEDVFVAVFSNCDCVSPKDITARMAALAIGKPYAYTEIPVDSATLKGYTGVYENSYGEQRIITVSENQLYSQRGNNPKFNIKAWQKDKFFFEDALLTIEFSRSETGEIEKLITHSRDGNEIWNKSDKPIATQIEIQVDEKVLETYVGEYEIEPTFTFTVTKEQDRLFVQATGQEKFEILAETETKFLSKVNDARFEFVNDEAGNVTKVILQQGGNQTDAKKIK